MKKLLKFILFLGCIYPLFVHAETIDYDIINYYIYADIEENGDVKVTELLVLDGKFNGYVRDIEYKNTLLGEEEYKNNQIYNASGIEIVDIAVKKVKNVSFSTVKEDGFLSLTKGKASNLGYTETIKNNLHSYKMYYKSNHEKVAFKITYILKDVIVLHKDVAELYWTFIGKDYEDTLKDVRIQVNLPKKDDSGNFRVWAHGDMIGEIHSFANSYLLATINKVNAHNSVDVRTTFSKNLMNQTAVKKQTNQEALEEIIAVETVRAEEMNEKREKAKKIYYGFLSASILYLIGLLFAWIYVYIKYDKEYKSTFTNDYNREFIDDYNVEVIDYLLHKNITPNALSASIMNLIYKKVIKVEEIEDKKNNKEYLFTLTDSIEKTNDTEKYLLKFLFETVGEGQTFTSKELKNYAKSTKTCEKFLANYTQWKHKVINDGKKEAFYEIHSVPIIIGVSFLLVAIFLNIGMIAMHASVILVYLLLLVALVFFIYTLVFTKRSKKGVEHFSKWKAFKKFLNDFGDFEVKELPEITLWERYMVYATIFGLAKKVAKTMNVKIKELENAGIYMGSFSPTFSDWYFYNTIDYLFTNSITTNRQAITSLHANSSSSSGGGFGGGFSSGGGFGGGGGGGHGF